MVAGVELYERAGWRVENVELRVIYTLLGSWNLRSLRLWSDLSIRDVDSKLDWELNTGSHSMSRSRRSC